MAQLKEDEWPEAGEPTTTERETPTERNRAADDDAPRGAGADSATPAVPRDDARLKNVTPDEAVD
jgi:hypothetical protein